MHRHLSIILHGHVRVEGHHLRINHLRRHRHALARHGHLRLLRRASITHSSTESGLLVVHVSEVLGILGISTQIRFIIGEDSLSDTPMLLPLGVLLISVGHVDGLATEVLAIHGLDGGV